jgi:LPXTG-site transpeptidase (sortase) family protein
MENPDGPEVVAWYNFTAKPGLGAGNAVFSGHVDYHNYGRAVFWDVGKLVEGDLVEVELDDGTVVQFSVTALHSYDVAEIPMDEVLASTSTESVTLITCTGQFTQGAYTHRLVVRAIRVGLIPSAT